MSQQDMVLAVKNGTPIMYPFDMYTAEFFIAGQFVSPSPSSSPPNDTMVLKRQRFPISLVLSNNMEDWFMECNLKDGSHDEVPFDLIMVEIKFKRGYNQRFFSLFVVLLMWVLSFSMLALSLTCIVYQGTVDSPSNCLFG